MQPVVPSTHVRGKDAVVRVPDARIALSTASVYPESTATAFELAARLGFDGVEVMVGADPLSQDVDALRRISDYHQVPIVSIHAPTLLITQRVWGTDPWGKIDRSAEAAKALGASVVVVHPPFRWQRDYARDFVAGIARRQAESGVSLAVENMFPWKAAGQGVQAYLPGWDPRDFEYAEVTLDLSHTATAGVDAYQMAYDLGDRLTHIHLADGSGSNKDEHLVPGRGSQRCSDVLELLARRGFTGSIVLEVNTRKATGRTEREADLVEALAFARLSFAAPVVPSYAVTADGTIEAVASQPADGESASGTAG
ncbi:sugar phosphate isomerase/epimerase [Actinopolymorpha rutila]|uniref:Sugar phosphate isomerase/epimerase n=1 Tax=Actinopolymorpha rutila TaxID=446787 RepID=A0A852ZHL6_9ACTN|nr:sugar phosphate isomerase/epimerase [Actinopolymorpha rutila]